METKKWYHSRQLWVNFIGAAAVFAQSQFGFVMPAEYQAYLLLAINAILRLDTSSALST